MLKWLIFALLGYLAFTYWQRRHLSAPESRTRRQQRDERMVACAHCGVHLPEGESLRDAAAQPYCCEEHRRLGARRSG